MLQRQQVQDWMIKRLQGSFVASDFLPTTTTQRDVFKYFLRGIIGGQTPEVGENDKGDLIHTEYEQRSASTKYYRERTSVSTYANQATIDFADLVQDDINFLTDRGALRLESERINAITTSALTATQWKNKFWSDLNEGSRNWSGGSGSVSVIDDLLDAVARIRKYSRMPPDTLLCGTEAALALQKNTETKDWFRQGPIANQRVQEGRTLGIEQPLSDRENAQLGRIAGLEVYVSSAVTLVDEEDIHSDLQPLLENDVYIFKRGTDLGRTVFFEPPTIITDPVDRMSRSQEWQFGMAFIPVVYRPELIYKYENVVA
jgi:hypothetical protein